MAILETVLKRFEEPDEVRRFEKGKFELVHLGGMAIGRATHEPGWKWSVHVGPKVGATRCNVENVGMVLCGCATAAMEDGRIHELRAGTLFYIPPGPPGHDSWVVGDAPYVSLKQEPLKTKLSGTVEMDESYVGGKRKKTGQRGRPSINSHKAPVVSLVQRDGKVISRHVERVSAHNLKEILTENVHADANVMTDNFTAYDLVKKTHPNHDIIKHSSGVYSRREGSKRIHTNTVEGFFSLLKRGIHGSFHHVSKQHLHRYLGEFDFRYNARGVSDGERTLLAIKGVTGKRLTYRDAKKRAITL